MNNQLPINRAETELNQWRKTALSQSCDSVATQAIVVPVSGKIVIRQVNRTIEQNSQSLHQQVQRAGFPDLSTKIDE